jgi:hypothetical protein
VLIGFVALAAFCFWLGWELSAEKEPRWYRSDAQLEERVGKAIEDTRGDTTEDIARHVLTVIWFWVARDQFLEKDSTSPGRVRWLARLRASRRRSQ